MRVAVFSDVHGNLPALERFVEVTRSWADSYLCLGDVVNYGPWSDECLELVLSLPGIVLLEGNHESLFRHGSPVAHEIPLVQAFFAHSYARFTRKDLIDHLPQDSQLGKFRCIHTIDERRIYADTPLEIEQDYMIGHSHHQFLIQRSGFTIASCGSVGQNRSALEILNYLRYDSGSVTLHQEPYSVDSLFAEMVARDYPRACLEYYASKRSAAGRLTSGTVP
jgi:predicted phosphodiesterase